MTTNYPGSLDSFSTKTDGIDSVLASHMNDVQDAIEAIETELGANVAGSESDVASRLDQNLFEAATAESTSATGNITLTNTSAVLQYINCNGADRIVTLPSAGSSNHPFIIVNTSSSDYKITVKDASSTVISVARQYQGSLVVSNGTGWNSIPEKRTVTLIVQCLEPSATTTTGDGKHRMTVPSRLNGMILIHANAAVYTVSSSGTPTFMVHNQTGAADMLTTAITIDVSEYNSYTATTPSVVDTSNDDVYTGDILRFDCDVAGTDTTGMDIILIFQEG